MHWIKELISSRKKTIGVVLILVVLISTVGVETHKASLLLPGPLTKTNKTGKEINGYVSHADFEQDCGHCHGPIHCVKDNQCQDCHKEVAEERASAMGLHSRLPGVERCQTCHTEHEGRSAVITSFAYANINHELLAEFSLEKHREDFDHKPLGCESCHTQNSFIPDELDCVSCHAGEDHNFLKGHIQLYGPDCTACHDGRDRYSGFQHADVYPLDGAHGNTDCQDCHPEQVFAGTSQECASCHEEPEVHTGFFGFKCERCHSATAWLPAQLKAHTFIVDHGDEKNLTCETCHKDTYTDYPCYSCHDSERMRVDHDEHGIYAFENCIECHPTGREGEAGQYVQVQSGSKPEDPKQGDGSFQGEGRFQNQKMLEEDSSTLKTRHKHNAKRGG